MKYYVSTRQRHAPAEPEETHSRALAGDACGHYDSDEDKVDDCLVAMKEFNDAANSSSDEVATYGVSSRAQIIAILASLKAEGYSFHNIILNGHGSQLGKMFLGGGIDITTKAGLDEWFKILSPYVNSTSSVVFNSCNLGAGHNPRMTRDAFQNLAQKIGCDVFASMSFGSGAPLSGGVLSTRKPYYEYFKLNYSNNAILYENCYLRCMPLRMANSNTIVSDLILNKNGTFKYSSDASATLAENEIKLEWIRGYGRIKR